MKWLTPRRNQALAATVLYLGGLIPFGWLLQESIAQGSATVAGIAGFALGMGTAAYLIKAAAI